MQTPIGFIGGGTLATAIITQLIHRGGLSPGDCLVSRRDAHKAEAMQHQFGIVATTDNHAVSRGAGVVVIAVKPQDLLGVLQPLSGDWRPGQWIISAVAGWTLQDLRQHVPVNVRDRLHWVRISCNTATRLGHGVVGYVAPALEPEQQKALHAWLSALGYVHLCKTEAHLDALLVATSCGAGFLFRWMQDLHSWLVKNGFAAREAQALIVKTVFGSSLLAEKSDGLSFVELCEQVTSKGGMTYAGLSTLHKAGVTQAVHDACEAALTRGALLRPKSD